ncbi:hypothetical protein SLS62_010351 [Diatrype stigma]|uniref:Uncharacterized protein n=1 Tax=Diatrype stigma TaxID=117547 RepID=A0AAN9YIW0_9PEZI
MVSLHQSAVLLAASVLAHAAAVSGTPLKVVSDVVVASPPPVGRGAVEVVAPAPRDLRSRATSLMKRDANATLDLGFQVENQVLFDGPNRSQKELAADLDIHDSPSLNLNVPLKLECVDCRTWGSVEVLTFLPDDIGDFFEDLSDFDLFNNANLSLVFNGVGAFIDVDVVTTQKGGFALPLFTSQSPLGVAGPNFQIGVVFSVEIALGITGEIDINSGFQLSIPDGSSFTMPLDPAVDNTADFDGTMFSMLPLAIDAPANITVALRLRVQAGLEFVGSPLLSAQALAGAYLNIPEVVLGETLTLGGNTSVSPGWNASIPAPAPAPAPSCTLPAFAEVNINAGVFIDVGADVGVVKLGDFNPTLSTTFFQAAVSTCLDGLAGSAVPTPSALLPYPYPNATITATTAPAPALACPTDLVTETITTASTMAVTSCVLPVLNCPANMTQVVMAEQTETITSSSCPVAMVTSVAQNTTTAADVSTTECPEKATVAAAPTPTPTPALALGGLITLNKLAIPITSELVVDPTITPPPVPTVMRVVGSNSNSTSNSSGM